MYIVQGMYTVQYIVRLSIVCGQLSLKFRFVTIFEGGQYFIVDTKPAFKSTSSCCQPVKLETK